MKRIFCLLLSFMLLAFMTACNHSNEDTESQSHMNSDLGSNPMGSAEAKPEYVPKPPITEEENFVLNIEIVVGDRSFSATLYDNETSRALKDQLPMTLNMSELNGNEKYYYLSDKLPTDASRPSSIHTGDLMLYGNNCLVLFYESFSTSYSYTPIGHIDDTIGLADALGTGSVQVTFR